MVEVIVVGAGITGLACAQRLAKAGVDVHVFDAAPTPGGVMNSFTLDGHLFESGPNSIPATAANFRTLVEESGLNERVITSNDAAKTRYLFFGGRLVALPTGPGSLLRSKLLSVGAKLRLLSEPLRKYDPGSDEDPDFESFLTERLGRGAARTLGGSFVRGIYACELDALGTASAFPRLWKLASEHGGIVRGMRAKRRASETTGPRPSAMQLLSLEGGLGSLPRAIADGLGARLELSQTVDVLRRTEGGWSVQLECGRTVEAESVVLTTPARVTSRLIADLAGSEGLCRDLNELPHASVRVVNLGFERDGLPDGFGFLVPPDESARGPAPAALGILFVSKIFPGRAPQGGASASAIYRASDVSSLDEAALVERALGDLALACGNDAAPAPAVQRIVEWDDVIPSYGSGHRARMERGLAALREHAPGLELAGNFTGGVSVDDCIAKGFACAESVAARIPAGGTA